MNAMAYLVPITIPLSAGLMTSVLRNMGMESVSFLHRTSVLTAGLFLVQRGVGLNAY